MPKEHMVMVYDDAGKLAEELNAASEEGWEVVGYSSTPDTLDRYPTWSALVVREKK